jgi:hypothetical protein
MYDGGDMSNTLSPQQHEAIARMALCRDQTYTYNPLQIAHALNLTADQVLSSLAAQDIDLNKMRKRRRSWLRMCATSCSELRGTLVEQGFTPPRFVVDHPWNREKGHVQK